MDSPKPGAVPIGWTELLAGTVATLFAVASAWGLLTVMATSPRAAAAGAPGDLAAAPRPAPAANRCAGGPALGAMRLGTPRIYGQAGISLEPVPLSVIPAISAQQAYGKAALKPAGCQTEEILAYLSGGNPTSHGLLAWAVVSASACGSRRCVTVSPVDATTGQALSPSFFAIEPGK